MLPSESRVRAEPKGNKDEKGAKRDFLEDGRKGRIEDTLLA